jgi:hypothetical protein
VKLIILVASATLIAACSTAPPTIQQGPNAEISYDGLHKIDNSRLKEAWADPDVDFSRYSKVMGGGSEFQFRAVKKTPSATQQRRGSSTEFWIDDATRNQLVETVNEIFDEEIANSTRFEVTDTKGADVLIIRGGLHDIVSHAPPELMGRGEIYLRSVGEATLIIEILDSMSGEVIYRGIERRSAERPGSESMIMNSVTSWAEVRRLARDWAVTLREGLDSVPEA